MGAKKPHEIKSPKCSPTILFFAPFYPKQKQNKKSSLMPPQRSMKSAVSE
jgi:hypothetical protein